RPTDFDLGALPSHLRIHFVVVDGTGRVIGTDDDLSALRRERGPSIRALVAGIAHELRVTGDKSWTFGEIPRRIERDGIVGYPSLIDEGGAVGVGVLDSPSAQSTSMWEGLRRLLILAAPLP